MIQEVADVAGVEGLVLSEVGICLALSLIPLARTAAGIYTVFREQRIIPLGGFRNFKGGVSSILLVSLLYARGRRCSMENLERVDEAPGPAIAPVSIRDTV